MKNTIAFLIIILAGVLIANIGCKPSAENLFYSQLQKDLSGEGRFTFEGTDGKRYRYWTVSDILLNQKNRDKIFADQLETIKKYQLDNIQISDSTGTTQPQFQFNPNTANWNYSTISCQAIETFIPNCDCNDNDTPNNEEEDEVCGGTNGGNSKCMPNMFWEGMSRCFIVNDLFNTKISKFNAKVINPIGAQAKGSLPASILDFDSNNIQVVDFGVCSSNLDIRGQYAVDIELNKISAPDLNIAASLPMLIGNP